MKRNTALILAVLLLAPGCVTPPPTLKEIASTLPKEFKDIVFTEHLGVGTALFGQLFKGKNNGPLVVSRDRIEQCAAAPGYRAPVASVAPSRAGSLSLVR